MLRGCKVGWKGVVGVWKERLQSERSGGQADLQVRGVNSTCKGIDGPVGQEQLNLQLLEAFLAVTFF